MSWQWWVVGGIGVVLGLALMALVVIVLFPYWGDS